MPDAFLTSWILVRKSKFKTDISLDQFGASLTGGVIYNMYIVCMFICMLIHFIHNMYIPTQFLVDQILKHSFGNMACVYMYTHIYKMGVCIPNQEKLFQISMCHLRFCSGNFFSQYYREIFSKYKQENIVIKIKEVKYAENSLASFFRWCSHRK